jgi:hypothetical protein
MRKYIRLPTVLAIVGLSLWTEPLYDRLLPTAVRSAVQQNTMIAGPGSCMFEAALGNRFYCHSSGSG